MMEIFREQIRALRIKMDWTQEELAREIGVSLSTVQRWEKRGGKPTLLPRRQLMKLMKKNGIVKW